MPPTAPRPAATVTALVPLRTGGKSRLRTELEEAPRAALVLAMLDDVLAALRMAGIADVRLLAGDDGAATAGASRGLEVLRDPRPSGDPTVDPSPRAAGDVRLRAAVDAGLSAIGHAAARLVVAADLPLLQPEEIGSLLRSTADVALAPTSGGGTAMLRLGPGVTLASCHGGRSADAHAALARAQGRSVEVLELPGARHDVDGALDLDALAVLGPCPLGAATASFLSAARG